jgi:hypothetical protein
MQLHEEGPPLEKLIVFQPVKEFPAIYENGSFITLLP